MEYKIGMIIDGKVTGIQPYGAFVSLDGTTQGLIHISEVQKGYIRDIKSALKIGEQIQVQIIDKDEYSGKISLSMRTLQKNQFNQVSAKKRYFTNKNKKIGFQTVQEELPIWIHTALEDLNIMKKI